MAINKVSHSMESIMDLFMDYAVENGLEFSIDNFCDSCNIDHSTFYTHFESIDDIEQKVWENIMNASIHTVLSDDSFILYEAREKLLSLYYTFFENCNLNRAFIMVSLTHHKMYQVFSVVSKMKSAFISFINDAFGKNIDFQIQFSGEINKIKDRAMAEGFWAQLLFLIDFWKNDESDESEKTDVAIEKAVRASVDLMDITPIKSVFDFGKFIWQERISKK